MKKWKRIAAVLLSFSLMAGQLLTCYGADGTQSLESYLDEGNVVEPMEESLSFPTRFLASDSNSRMALYAVDPVTAMAGEELAAWVFAAIAAACGISIQGSVEDLAMDYNYWLNRMQSEAEYKLTFYEGMAAGTYIIGQEAFQKSKSMWDSLVAGTYEVIDNGIAVTADMIDTVSAYFGDRAQAYTPSMKSSYSPISYQAVHFGGGTFSYTTTSNINSYLAIPSSAIWVAFRNQVRVYNPTDSPITVVSGSAYKKPITVYYDTVIASHKFDGVASSDFCDVTGIESVEKYVPITVDQLNAYILSVIDANYQFSIADNAVLADAVPWEAWETTTTADDDVIILNPGDYGNPDDLGKDLGDAITAGILAGLLGKLGLKEKEGGGSDIPTPTSAEGGTDIPSSGAGEGEGDVSLSDIIDSLAGFGEQVQALPGSIAQAISDVVIGTPDSSLAIDSIIVDKFPFCIPYDLVSCVTVLQAESTPPVWKVPFVIDSLSFRYEITLDLTQWTQVIAVIRGFLLLMFIAGLVILTRTLIRG